MKNLNGENFIQRIEAMLTKEKEHKIFLESNLQFPIVFFYLQRCEKNIVDLTNLLEQYKNYFK